MCKITNVQPLLVVLAFAIDCEVYDKDHVLPLVDVDCIGEVISAIIAIDQGVSRQTITSSFGHRAKEAVDSLFV